MPNTITAKEMRDRLLSRFNDSPKNDDWVQVLAVPGHRDLLGIVARRQPGSIGALAQLAGRAQPNVSRSLNALSRAGLVKVEPSGRLSIPRLTELGAAKAHELGLLEIPEVTPELSPEDQALFSVDFQDRGDDLGEPGNDECLGQLTTWVWLRLARERCVARTETDLDALSRHLLTHWWRILYRRDAPFKLWDFNVPERSNRTYAFLATAHGTGLFLSARNQDGGMLDLERGTEQTTTGAFERQLVNEIIRPVASRHWLCGHSGRPIHDLLARLEDAWDDQSATAFCKTAGALSVVPYGVGDALASQIRDLMDRLPEEDARLDFASALLSEQLEAGRTWATSELERLESSNRLEALQELRQACSGADVRDVAQRPFSRGIACARATREALKLSTDQSVGGFQGLAKLFGGSSQIEVSDPAPGAIRGFQRSNGHAPVIVVENEGERSSLFVFARAIGDYLAFGSRASCVADLYTDRQAVGRAFAAEFMAPSDAVVRMIVDEDQPAAKVADHFGVQPQVIHRQFENNWR